MKKILITGCNRGLGKELLEHFASKGWDIIVCNRKQYEDFDQFSETIETRYSINIHTYYAELDNKKSLQECLIKITSEHTTIDALINNAGYYSNGSIFSLEYEDVERCFQVNYLAPFTFCKAVAELMIRQGNGVIINISSILGHTVTKCGSSYGASKAALNYLTQTLAQELASFGIRVNAICCADLESGMFHKLSPKQQKERIQRIAMRRLAKLNEVADAVDFLVSNNASFITGALLRVDGGGYKF